MKKLRRGFAIFTFVLVFVLSGHSAYAADNDVYYFDGTKTMSDYAGQSTVVVTADTKNGYSNCISGRNIKHVVIGEGITYLDGGIISEEGRSNIPGTFTLTISSTVKEIKNLNIKNIESISLDSRNKNFVFQNGILYTKDLTKMIAVPVNIDVNNVKLPSTLKEIYVHMLNNKKILTIPRDCINVYLGDNKNEYDIEKVKVEKGNTKYAAKDGCLYNKKMTKMLYCPSQNRIKKIVLPSSVKEFSLSCLDYNPYVEELVLSKKVKTIEGSLFVLKNLKSISVSKENPYFASKSGVLFNKKMTMLLFYPNGKRTKEYKFPATVKRIDSGVATNRYVEKLILPAGLEKFNTYYSYTGFEKLKSITIDQANKKFSCQDGVLYNKKKTKMIMYPVQRAKTTYETPEQLQSLPFEFLAGTKIRKLKIGKSVKEISTGTGWDNLQSISVSGKNKKFSSKDGILYNKKKSSLILIPKDYRRKSIVIPDSVTESKCEIAANHVTSLTLGKKIYSVRFGNLPMLSKVLVASENKSYCVVENKLYSKNIYSLELYPAEEKSNVYQMPDTVMHIQRFAFGEELDDKKGNKYIEKLEIGKSFLDNFMFRAEGFTALKEITVSMENEWLAAKDGVLYSKDLTQVKWYPQNKLNTVYTIPATVISIDCGEDFIRNPYLITFTVETGNKFFWVDDQGILYRTDGSFDTMEGVPGHNIYNDLVISEFVRGMQSNLNDHRNKIKNIVVNNANQFYYMKDGELCMVNFID